MVVCGGLQEAGHIGLMWTSLQEHRSGPQRYSGMESGLEGAVGVCVGQIIIGILRRGGLNPRESWIFPRWGGVGKGFLRRC
jgi:hypothetical protein